MKLNFKVERQTKGAVRYIECDNNWVPLDEHYKIGTLYIRKTAFTNGAPDKLIVTVEDATK